jgi:hypothetical protein
MRALEQEDLDTSRTAEGLPAVYRKQDRDDEAEKLDGTLEASASEDGTARLWGSATGAGAGHAHGPFECSQCRGLLAEGQPV